MNPQEKTHFIGIGGIGMSALARILLQKGAKVSGSDVSASPITERLAKEGAEIFIGQDAKNIAGATSVVYSTDIRENNPEYQEVLQRKIPLLHRSEFLAQLMKGSVPLLVTGTHGKTTTSSLLAHVLIHSGLKPTYAIGGIVRSTGANSGYGKGQYFVAEADESDGSFLRYPSFGAIITNIGNDHLNYWKTEEALLDGFTQFAKQVSSREHLFWCADDEALASLGIEGISYGFDEKADLRVHNYLQREWKNSFDLTFEDVHYPEIEIPLIGGHNVLNASAVFGMGLKLEIPEETLRQAFLSFQGVGRRVEKKGEYNSISIYDDYGHHPTEIFATIRAVKAAIHSRRLVVAFQPHRYTRTRDCMNQFPEAFDYADEIILTDIYPASESPIPGITGEALFAKFHQHAGIHFVKRAELSSFLSHLLKPQDVLLTLGAGDITKVGPEVLTLLQESGVDAEQSKK